MRETYERDILICSLIYTFLRKDKYEWTLLREKLREKIFHQQYIYIVS